MEIYFILGLIISFLLGLISGRIIDCDFSDTRKEPKTPKDIRIAKLIFNFTRMPIKDIKKLKKAAENAGK